MKHVFKHTPAALAVVGLFAYSGAFAEDGIQVDSVAGAAISDSQVNSGNLGLNNLSSNNALIGTNSLNDTSGNIGVNVAAGDNNQQANAAALAAADQSFVFTAADASASAFQGAYGNMTSNLGQVNAASLGSNVLNGVSGNIGVNIAAGNSNQQKNDMALSVGTNSVATANSSVAQENMGNTTANDIAQSVFLLPIPTANTASLGDSVLNGATGNIGVNIAAGTSNQQYNGMAMATVR